jgi:hypothetical protein
LVSVPIFVVRFVSDHGKEHILLCVFAGARQTIFVTRFIFWRTKKSVCCTFYFLEGQTNFFFLPPPWRYTAISLCRASSCEGAQQRRSLCRVFPSSTRQTHTFAVHFVLAQGKHIPLPCVFLKRTSKYFKKLSFLYFFLFLHSKTLFCTLYFNFIHVPICLLFLTIMCHLKNFYCIRKI